MLFRVAFPCLPRRRAISVASPAQSHGCCFSASTPPAERQHRVPLDRTLKPPSPQPHSHLRT